MALLYFYNHNWHLVKNSLENFIMSLYWMQNLIKLCLNQRNKNYENIISIKKYRI